MPDPARHVCAGFEGYTVTEEVRELVRRGVRAFILFARNAESRAQVHDLCDDILSLSDEPILVCVDQEGGDVRRLTTGFEDIPAMREVTDVEAAKSIGQRLGRDLRDVGIGLNLAPVLDVDSNPDNPVIGPRSFSADPRVCAQLGAALIGAMQHEGVAACAKHFPGHGDTALDSHHALPRVTHDLERLESIELKPFRSAITVGVAAIMTAHVMYDAIDPDLPATLSPAVVDGLLRCELHFPGVVISDDLEMSGILDHHEIGAAAVTSLRAGVDLVLCCHTPERQHRILDALDEAARDGTLDGARLASSRERLDQLWSTYAP